MKKLLSKKWVLRCGLVLLGLAAALVVCEVAVRIGYGGLVVTASLVKRDSEIGSRLIAGARGRGTCSAYAVTYAISSQASRGVWDAENAARPHSSVPSHSSKVSSRPSPRQHVPAFRVPAT